MPKLRSSTLFTKILSYRWLNVLLVSSLLVLQVPALIRVQYPCLSTPTDTAYYYHQCNTPDILDHSIMLYLLILIAAGFITFIIQPRHKIKYAAFNLTIISTLSIAGFYIHLYSIIASVESASIILSPESFLP